MVSKETLIKLLPVRDQVVLTEDRQNTDDIRTLLLKKHKEYAPDYDLISGYFDAGNIVDTSRDIFDFLKQNVPYTKESGKYQTIKSPASILTCNGGNSTLDRVDCKNYASFIGGVIDSIKRNDGGSWDWTYRFASYNENDPEPGHVFVVVKIDEKELWIDPVFTFFNGGSMHEWELDQRPAIGGLYSISGPNDAVQTVVTTSNVTVNTQVAWVSFLRMVNENVFSIRDLMLSFPNITMTQVEQFCINDGFDFNQLTNFINYASKN